MKILYVDDDRSLRTANKRYFTACGHDPLLATCAEEAMDIVTATPDLGLVITDLNMPANCEGLVLVSAIHEHNPRLPIILNSGDMDDQIALEAMRRGAKTGLCKTHLYEYLRQQKIVT